MSGTKKAAAAMVTVLAVGAAVTQWPTGAAGDSSLRATIVDTAGNVVGTAKLDVEDDKTAVKVQVSLPASMAGFHGFHIHSKGECTGSFTSAGGHLGEDAADPTHRHRNHPGDLPVLLVNADGTASARFHTDRVQLADLMDADGAAFIVHAGPDNYANIPSRYSNPNAVAVYPGTTTDQTTLQTGDAGARVACGVIR